MKVALNQKIFTIDQYTQKRQNVVFAGNSVGGPSADSFKTTNSAKSLFENILIGFSDRINLEKNGDKTKIPNCIMLETRSEGAEALPIEWLKKTADCNVVHLADRNNDDLADTLWEELKKSKDAFEQTKHRTIIHVEGFDRLITEGQNSFENIDSIKDIMNRTANDFGATIIFKTKDASRLTSEAIQPQRVTNFIINSSKAELEKYNVFLNSRGYFKDYEKRIASKIAGVSKPEVKKGTAKVPSKQLVQPKSRKSIVTSDAVPQQQTEQLKPSGSSPVTSLPKESSEQKPKGRITKPIAETADINPPKISDLPPKNDGIKKVAEKASDGPKTFKLIAIIVAVGAAIAGAIYYIKNKNHSKSTKKS